MLLGVCGLGIRNYGCKKQKNRFPSGTKCHEKNDPNFHFRRSLCGLPLLRLGANGLRGHLSRAPQSPYEFFLGRTHDCAELRFEATESYITNPGTNKRDEPCASPASETTTL